MVVGDNTTIKLPQINSDIHLDKLICDKIVVNLNKYMCVFLKGRVINKDLI